LCTASRPALRESRHRRNLPSADAYQETTAVCQKEGRKARPRSERTKPIPQSTNRRFVLDLQVLYEQFKALHDYLMVRLPDHFK
jgi:hypothetical protein